MDSMGRYLYKVVPPQLQMGYNPMKTSSIYHQHSYHSEIGQT